ncbi:hypothetical protein SDC9_127064 [bioreactor metagenome]|uniref:Uncharacterized protein n=1 Tax=bioreactor metagenome TaxID=1076179 RepID=A0A645CSZ7_9ZZZZ
MLEPEDWERRARALIEKYGEQDLFRRLLAVPWVNGGWLRTAGEREKYCLEWHMSRIFENPKWVGYREFHAKD